MTGGADEDARGNPGGREKAGFDTCCKSSQSRWGRLRFGKVAGGRNGGPRLLGTEVRRAALLALAAEVGERIWSWGSRFQKREKKGNSGSPLLRKGNDQYICGNLRNFGGLESNMKLVSAKLQIAENLSPSRSTCGFIVHLIPVTCWLDSPLVFKGEVFNFFF